MNIRDFKKSKYVQAASNEAAENKVKEYFPKWKQRVKNAQIVENAGNLFNAVFGNKCNFKDKAIIIGALIYIFTPIDIIPDFIPGLGYLDDIGIATGVIAYILGKKDSIEMENTSSKEIDKYSDEIANYKPKDSEIIGPFDDVLISYKDDSSAKNGAFDDVLISKK